MKALSRARAMRVAKRAAIMVGRLDGGGGLYREQRKHHPATTIPERARRALDVTCQMD